jgi:hypothetical protein
MLLGRQSPIISRSFAMWPQHVKAYFPRACFSLTTVDTHCWNKISIHLNGRQDLTSLSWATKSNNKVVNPPLKTIAFVVDCCCCWGHLLIQDQQPEYFLFRLFGEGSSVDSKSQHLSKYDTLFPYDLYGWRLFLILLISLREDKAHSTIPQRIRSKTKTNERIFQHSSNLRKYPIQSLQIRQLEECWEY